MLVYHKQVIRTTCASLINDCDFVYAAHSFKSLI